MTAMMDVTIADIPRVDHEMHSRVKCSQMLLPPAGALSLCSRRAWTVPKDGVVRVTNEQVR
ncbi:hypothetical protein ACFQYP_51705 [Nonomuraea antimicrobica]